MELDLRKSPWNSGMNVRWDVALKEIYYLLNIFYGSKSFDNLDELCQKFLRQEFQETEVNRILLTLAITIRNIWDFNPSSVETNLEGADMEVGQLIANLKQPKITKVLEFREALNKIVHCTSINYEYSSAPAKVGDALLPVVHLYGEKGKLEWRASLDVVKFCVLATYVI
ncbi:MAG: hypothetical protein NVSMB56_07150 [Pyrinomonadaceae bacterium]